MAPYACSLPALALHLINCCCVSIPPKPHTRCYADANVPGLCWLSHVTHSLQSALPCCWLQDFAALDSYCRDTLGQELNNQELSISGRTWGAVELNNSSLVYRVDGKVMFEVPLPEVSQAQQAKVCIVEKGMIHLCNLAQQTQQGVEDVGCPAHTAPPLTC